jgi:hyaluronan synthase
MLKNQGTDPVKAVPATQEKRRRARICDPFPATLVYSKGLLRRATLRGSARDYDSEGACITCSRSLAAGTRVSVRLHLPRTISEFFRGLPCEFPARVSSSRKRKTADRVVYDNVLKWDRPLPETVKAVVSSYQRKIGALIAAVMVTVVWFKWSSFDYFWYEPFFYVYSATLITYLLSRFFISWRHRSPELGDYTPSLSIVISVRNEEEAIARTVDTCYATDYPADKREVLVVNDGSTDGTARVLEELQKKHADLKVCTLPPSGKRAAMAVGVRKARGEIIVFVDSDTFLFPDSLRNIVCGFEDPSLGASAGYTEVENANKNALTGLQEVRYFVSYRLLKSSESLFDCVTCCPGCLSAYRRAYVMEFLEPWLTQTFLGAPATFGDDRSLTNFILRKYRVIYNDHAVASTLVPETWGHYMRQQVRWKKSWLRETLIASRFMYRKHPVAALSFYSAAFFSLLSPVMAVRVLYLLYQGHVSIFLYYVAGLILIGLLQSLYFLYKRPSPHWLLGMLWMASSLVITGPQTYYAILTMRKNHWGTR